MLNPPTNVIKVTVTDWQVKWQKCDRQTNSQHLICVQLASDCHQTEKVSNDCVLPNFLGHH